MRGKRRHFLSFLKKEKKTGRNGQELHSAGHDCLRRAFYWLISEDYSHFLYLKYQIVRAEQKIISPMAKM